MELVFYVKNLINDGDYATLRRNLLQIANAHANRIARQRLLDAARRSPR